MHKSQALSIVRKTKQNYNTMAADWHFTRRFPSAPKIKLLRDLKPSQKVLDVGCGNGIVAGEIIRRGANYTGLDISAKLLAIARRDYKKAIKNKQAKFVLGEANKMPFVKNSFDAIFSYAVMHHIPSLELRLGFLKEIHRVLKPGGRVAIINWNLLNNWSAKRFNIKEQLAHCHPELEANDVFVPWKATKGKKIDRYFHIFTKPEILSLAREAGFKKYTAGFYNGEVKPEKNGEELILKLVK